MTETEKNVEQVISQIALNLSSINIEFRKLAIIELQKIASQISEKQFVKISAGLFYYYWFSDGPSQQTADRNLILLFSEHMSDELQIKWFGVFFESLSELWETIDRIRVEKYLLLLKESLLKVYSKFNGSLNWKKDWTHWNAYLSGKVVFNYKCGLTSH